MTRAARWLTLAVTLVLTAHVLRRPSRSRRWWIALAAVAVSVACGVAVHRALPGLVASRIERMLAAGGFPGAHVRVSSLGLDHVELVDVTLGDGLALGTVELDAGVSLLWRPRIHQLTIRGARLSAMPVAMPVPMIDRLLRLRQDLPGGAPPFEVVRIAGGIVTIRGVDVAVSGTIAPAAHTGSVELEATTDLVTLGGVELRDLRATVHDAGAGLRTCATGHVAGATLEVCGTLPRTLSELGEVRAVDTTWRASAPAWQLHGRGTLAWASTLALTGGHIDAEASSLTAGAATVHNGRVTAELAGNLSSLALDVSATAWADRVELRDRAGAASTRMVQVPLVARVALIDGAIRVTPRRPIVATARDAAMRTAETVIELVQPSIAAYAAGGTIAVGATFAAPRVLRWSAAAARVGTAHLKAPSGALVERRTLRWRAAEAEWRGARFRDPAGVIELDAQRRHTAAWAGVSGPGPLELGPGEVRFHRSQDRWTLDDGRSAALGGELVLEPGVAAPHQPIALVIHARNLALHRVLASFAHGHADGSGILDGELAIEIDDAGPRVTRGTLRARAAGGLQLSDAAWRARASASATGFALHQRIAATLSDFEYSHLAAVLQPEGADPEVQVTTQGRGKHVAQDLDLVINLRGVRDVARRLPFAQPLRSKP